MKAVVASLLLTTATLITLMGLPVQRAEALNCSGGVCLPGTKYACLINGVKHYEIKEADCPAAQKKYTPKVPKKATANASNTVYNQPSGDDSASNKVCVMRPGDTAFVVKKGPQSWVLLSGISGGCGGKGGYVWNAGELTLP